MLRLAGQAIPANDARDADTTLNFTICVVVCAVRDAGTP